MLWIAVLLFGGSTLQQTQMLRLVSFVQFKIAGVWSTWGHIPCGLPSHHLLDYPFMAVFYLLLSKISYVLSICDISPYHYRHIQMHILSGTFI